MVHGIDASVVLLGLPGFRVLDLRETGSEVEAVVETSVEKAWCDGCGVRARSKGRADVQLRHLPSGGRPVRLIWRKRVWFCPELACSAKTWRERSRLARPRHVMTEPARRLVCERVGRGCHPVSEYEAEFGVGWATIMRAVHEHGQPLVDARDLGDVVALGLDETLFASAGPRRRAGWCTGFVDLRQARMLDLVRDRSRTAVQAWLDGRDPAWRAQIKCVALDPHAGYAAALRSRIPRAQLVLDPFHAIALANRCIDVVRRRVQHEVFGHRGRRADPLYGIRRLLLVGQERLSEHGRQRLQAGLGGWDGDRWDEVWAAHTAKEALRHVYTASTRRTARRRLTRFYEHANRAQVPEITTLASTIRRWEHELLAFFTTGASNAITEALNALVKKVKRIGHGFRNFDNYRLRVLLYTAAITWDTPSTVKIRGRGPSLVA